MVSSRASAGVGVGGVAFLPEEFRGAQEQPRAHLPAHHIGPLVDQHRQVAVALDPALEGVADDRLRRRPDDQRLLQFGLRIGLQLAVDLLQPVMGDDRHLLGEAFDVLGLPGDEAQGNEQREIAVLVAGFLDPPVERLLQQLPDAVAPRLDHHAAAHRRRLRQIRVADHVLVPFREIRLARYGVSHGSTHFLPKSARTISFLAQGGRWRMPGTMALPTATQAPVLALCFTAARVPALSMDSWRKTVVVVALALDHVGEGLRIRDENRRRP